MRTSENVGKFIPYDAMIVGFDYKMPAPLDGRFEITRNGVVIATVDHSIEPSKFTKLYINFGKNGILAVKDSADSPGLSCVISNGFRVNINIYFKRVM